LKRQIQELCGLNKLSRDERLIRANEILNSPDLKQAICNQILGISHKDVERAMLAVINERQLTKRQEELVELSASNPEKFDYEFEFKLNNKAPDKKPKTGYRTYTQEEVQKLLEASRTPYKSPEITKKTSYPPLPRELAEKFVREYLEYKKQRADLKKKLEAEWDSLKTTESETRTDTTTKPSKSTKASKRSATRTKKS
jgi:paraquat-inducible protein B